jgi:hypothetical protein
MDRPPLVVDPHRHDGCLCPGLEVADPDDLAHVHAGDPDGLALLDVVGGPEHRLDLVVVADRQPAREGEVSADDDQRERDQAGPHG